MNKRIEIKNTGFNIENVTPDPTAYILGASSLPRVILASDRDWTLWLPLFEPQERKIETNSCTQFSTIEIIEILMNRINVFEEDHSERYVAIASGNTDSGNDPHKVADYIRKECGLIPERLLPFDDTIVSFQEYLSPKPLPNYLVVEGKKWIAKWEYGHEWLWPISSSPADKAERVWEALQFSPVGVSADAWVFDGEYYTKDKGHNDNHWTKVIGGEYGKYFLVADSYISDGVRYKKLKWNYDFGIAKRYHLKLKEVIAKEQFDLLEKAKQVLIFLWRKLWPTTPLPSVVPVVPDEVDPPEPVQPKPETMQEMVIRVAQEEGLSEEMKKRIYKTIQCESNFNPNAKNENKDNGGNVRSTDWGICQYNDYYYIGIGRPIPSVHFALNEPEKCVRTMCKEFKAGRASHWECYKKLYPNG